MNVKITNMEHKIEELINDKKMLYDRIHDRISVELQRQKENGKEFISDEEIDKLIDGILKDEIYNKKQ
jgi:hypothetical protein